MAPTPEQLAEVALSDGAKEIWTTATGTVVRDVSVQTQDRRIEARAQEIAKAEIGEVKLSRAQRRLAAMRSNIATTPRLKLEIAEQIFCIRKLNVEGLTRVGLLSARDASGVLMISETGAFTGLMAAILFVCLAAEETGGEQFFESWTEAYDWASDADDVIVEVNQRIFEAATELNPGILPDDQLNADVAPISDEDDAPLVQTPASTK